MQIPIRNGEIESIKLELASDRPEINYGPTGSKILLESVRPLPGMSKINLTLERFSHNLDKLLRMDKLSAPANGGVSCYQAVFGVYTSLKKLFDHEKKMALAMYDTNTPNANHKAEREVLCKKSGRPRINAGTCLGLSLEYWMDRRDLIPHKPQPQLTSIKGKDKMDIDSDPSKDYPEDHDPDLNKMYSLTIECESSPSSMYSPIRISDAWISDNVEKPPDATGADMNNLLNLPTINWLNPPPTYLPASAPGSDHDAMSLDNAAGRLPNIRFVAKFNPPLVVPLSVVVNIHQSLGLDVPSDIRATTFVGLALRPSEPDPGLMGVTAETTQEIKAEKKVLVVKKDGTEEDRVHANSLHVQKTEYSRTIESLPFSHPRQLIEILPTLRQYAFTTSLLQGTFCVPPEPTPKTPARPVSPPATPGIAAAHPSMQVDITLQAYGNPQGPKLTLKVPHPKAPDLPSPSDPLSPKDALSFINGLPTYPAVNVTFDVLSNAEIVISEQNVVLGAQPKNKEGDVDMQGTPEVGEKVKRLARALDVCSDLGIWGEWLRRELE